MKVRQEEGMVTAETMVMLPVLVLVTLLLSGILQGLVAQAHAFEAAREGARLLARGESEFSTVERIHESLPEAEVRIVREGELVTVLVNRRFKLPAAPKLSPTLRARATVTLE